MIEFNSGNKRQYQCFVCGQVFKEYSEFSKHIIETHEEGREYLVCPLKHCGCPVRDLRVHFKNKHPTIKLPKNCQIRATVMYDLRNPSKKKKIPTFKEGYLISEKNGGRSVHYRSSYESQVYLALEKIGNVMRYDVEPFPIEYFYKGKKRNYYPDLKVEFTDGTIELWEIKPANQQLTDINQAKWAFARKYCQLRGWNFEVITEERIEQLKNHL